MLDDLLFFVAWSAVRLLQALPLTWVARVGRAGGGLAYYLDGRHRRVTQRNLAMVFGYEKSAGELRALARENFRRIGENFGCAIKTAAMTLDQLRPHVEFVAPELLAMPVDPPPQGVVAAIGHFGNFELYARIGQFAPAFQSATTYRGVRQASLNRLLQSLRERSGCRFFERRSDGPALRMFMRQPAVILGLLADQHGGDAGLRLPFMGHDCSTSAAPAVFALRYNCALLTGICYRVGLARWRIEAGAPIPTRENGEPRSKEAIMFDVNRAFEAAVRRDPANWFWVHNRWKWAKTGVQSPKSKVQSLEPVHGPKSAVSPQLTPLSPESKPESQSAR
jgi:KDO2-lipid IV(A) lauroyltransferase